MPRPKLLFENAAFAELFSVTVARTVVPSRNVIVPTGVPELDVTVAVKVTDWPKLDGLCELVSVVVVARGLTVWVSVFEDVSQVPVGLYVAVMVWLPTARAAVARVATPELLSVAVPRLVEPSLKVTVPVGVPLPEVRATVAVNVTDWVDVDGLWLLVSAVVVERPTTWTTFPLEVVNRPVGL